MELNEGEYGRYRWRIYITQIMDLVPTMWLVELHHRVIPLLNDVIIQFQDPHLGHHTNINNTSFTTLC